MNIRFVSCGGNCIRSYLGGDDEHTVHAGSAVGFAVELVVARFLELHGEGFAFLAELILHRDSFLRYALGDSILVEDNIVGAPLVVDPAI